VSRPARAPRSRRLRAVATRGLALLALAWSAPAHAFVGEVWDYLKQYQLGVDYLSVTDEAHVSYDLAAPNGIAEGCAAVGDDDDGRERCQIDISGTSANRWGVFLQQAFKRQGLYYFKPDLGFAARPLRGRMSVADAQLNEERGLPLHQLEYSLVAVVLKPYLTLGITPQGWPDVLVSLGPALQLAAGEVTINGRKETSAFAAVSGEIIYGFVELEIVLLRFGDGALSAVASTDTANGSQRGTKFYPKGVDGMSNFRADFSRRVGGDFYGFGAKLVTPWP
jgi:hypothetical protein